MAGCLSAVVSQNENVWSAVRANKRRHGGASPPPGRMGRIRTASVYQITPAPSAGPRAPDRRDGGMSLSLGGLKVIICEEFVKRELCELAVTAAAAIAVASRALRACAQEQEKPDCCVIAIFVCSELRRVIERGQEGAGRRLSLCLLSPLSSPASPVLLSVLPDLGHHRPTPL